MDGQETGKDIIAAPPKEEEGAEDQGGKEAVIDAAQAVMTVDLCRTVERARIQPLMLYTLLPSTRER